MRSLSCHIAGGLLSAREAVACRRLHTAHIAHTAHSATYRRAGPVSETDWELSVRVKLVISLPPETLPKRVKP